jgi:hypothetical protein
MELGVFVEFPLALALRTSLTQVKGKNAAQQKCRELGFELGF